MRLARRGGPIPLAAPVQQEVARKTSTPLFPKNWAFHLLRGECQVGKIGKRSPKWRWLQDKEGKSPGKLNKRRSEDGVRTSGKTNNTPGWPNLHRTGPGRDKHINRGARASSLSLSPTRWGALLLMSLDRHALTPRRWIFLLSSK